MRTSLGLVCLALVLGGCGGSGGSSLPDARGLCDLADRPTSTAPERAALYAEADRRVRALGVFRNTPTDRAIVLAVGKIGTAKVFDSIKDAPSPLGALISSSYPTLDDALSDLREACG